MTGKERLFDLIDKGRVGKNIGLSIGLPKLELYMDGLLPGTSYLIAAQSGVGKSTFSLYSFIYKPLMDYQNGKEVDRDPFFIMFNLEMTQEQIYAKLLSMYIYEHFGEQLTYKELFSRGRDTRLTDEHYELVRQCSDFLDLLDERLIFHDSILNAERYKNCVLNDLRKFGTFVSDGSYVPSNPDRIICVFIDHMSLTRASNGRSKKEEMDLISSYSVQMRNKYNISPIHIMQFNRNANNPERLKQAMQEPDSSDFKDSAAMYEDSHVVIALHAPIKFKLSSYRGYNIKELGHNFIACILLKSRFGTSDIAVGLGYYGDCSIFKELPKPDQINDYERFKSPDWTLSDTEVKNITFTL
jgi:replicative DNA helicase